MLKSRSIVLIVLLMAVHLNLIMPVAGKKGAGDICILENGAVMMADHGDGHAIHDHRDKKTAEIKRTCPHEQNGVKGYVKDCNMRFGGQDILAPGLSNPFVFPHGVLFDQIYPAGPNIEAANVDISPGFLEEIYRPPPLILS